MSQAVFLYYSSLPSQRYISSSIKCFAGHNKWSKIKTKKGILDAQRSAIYGKANRDIMVAVRNGGTADPEQNTTLAAILKRVKAQGIPKDNIEAALVKASRGKDGSGQSFTYEALAHANTGVVIECLSDNANRTIHSIREILTEHGARFAPVGFMFHRKGYVKVSIENDDSSKDRMIETALEASAEDFEEVQSSEGLVEIKFKCPPNGLAKLTSAITAPETPCDLLTSELIYTPIEAGQEPTEETHTRIKDLVEGLEENEDTLRVWTTLDGQFKRSES